MRRILTTASRILSINLFIMPFSTWVKFLLLLLPFARAAHANTYPASQQQGIVVNGQVTSIANEPLFGVTVLEVGTTRGTSTDANGHYQLEVSGPNAQLQVSYISYLTEIITVGNQTVINVQLVEDIMALDEVVVVGYGVQRKKDLTGAVSIVDMREVRRVKVSGIAEALQGQVAGVSVNSSGDPGRMADVRIRGVGSFANVGPLYVIDGLILNDANHINPADIETMQVMKDASATALYGSRGANGVIIITTKRGQEGDAKIDISTSYGVEEMGKRIEMMNTESFLYYNELSYVNAGRRWPGRPAVGDTLADTDWQSAIFALGSVSDYNLSVSGGGKTNRYMMSAGFFSQDGVLEGPWYDRYTFRVNTEGKRGIFTFGENISLIRTEQKLTNLFTSSFTNALSMPPTIPVYDPNEPSGRGGYGYGSSQFETYNTNPVALQQSIIDRQTNNRLVGNMYTELDLFKYFKYRANFGIDYWLGSFKSIDKAHTMRYASTQIKFNDKLYENRDERLSLLMEHTLTFNLQRGKHTVEALAGYTAQDNRWKFLANEGYNQNVEGKWQIDLIGEQNNMWGSEQRNTLISYLGRVNYNYDDRYLVQLNLRRDGSSKFGPKNRWGNFPSASLGWTISNESFFEPIRNGINILKLRASYGIIGDMQALGNYDHIPSVDFSGPYQGLYSFFGREQIAYIGAILTTRANPYLKWESKTTLNLGLDFGLLDNKLYGSAEWYDATSTDLLVRLPISLATGVGIDDVNYYSGSSQWTNYGQMRNRGIELTIGWRDNVGDLKYNVSTNFTALRNKVIKLGEAEGYREGDYGQVNRTQEGRSVADFYLIQTDGIFQSWDEVFAHTATLNDGTVRLIQPNAHPGDIRYVDYNNDGQIDLAGDRQWFGSPIPKFEMGLSLSAEYKGFDLSSFFTARYGNKIFNGQRHQLEAMDAPNNMPADLKPWTPTNPSNSTPRPLFGPNANVMFQTDRWLEDGSFFRIKNLQLGYTLPVRLLQNRAKIDRLRIYTSAQNLFTITNYKGYDPELSGHGVFELGCDWGQYPPIRSYMFGLQVSF